MCRHTCRAYTVHVHAYIHVYMCDHDVNGMYRTKWLWGGGGGKGNSDNKLFSQIEFTCTHVL